LTTQVTGEKKYNFLSDGGKKTGGPRPKKKKVGSNGRRRYSRGGEGGAMNEAQKGGDGWGGRGWKGVKVKKTWGVRGKRKTGKDDRKAGKDVMRGERRWGKNIQK